MLRAAFGAFFPGSTPLAVDRRCLLRSLGSIRAERVVFAPELDETTPALGAPADAETDGERSSARLLNEPLHVVVGNERYPTLPTTFLEPDQAKPPLFLQFIIEWPGEAEMRIDAVLRQPKCFRLCVADRLR
jgi:hypothetical protein